jgi:cell division protein FtsB
MATGSGGQGSTPRRTARRAAAPRPGVGGRTGAARPGTRPGTRTGAARAAAAKAASKAGPLAQAATARAARDGRGVRSLRRILVLASIMVLLAITLVPTLRSYLRQQGEIEAMRERVAAQRLTVEELQREQARWSDNAYVEQQARERLKFVKPGDRSYTVIDGDPERQPAPGVAAAPKSSADHPWYGQLWESAKVADASAVAGTRVPAPAPSR